MPPAATALTRAGQDARRRVAATSDRFVLRFVDFWMLFGAGLWLALYLRLPSIQSAGQLMLLAGVLAKCAAVAGRVVLARWLLVSFWTLFVLCMPWLLNGVRTPAMLLMTPLLMTAGWLLGRRVLLRLTVLCMLSVVACWLAETRGWWVQAVPLRSADIWMAVHMAALAATSFVVWTLVSNYEADYGVEMDLQRQLADALGQAEKANRELAAVVKFNETILLHSPVPIGVYSADGRCVEANDAYAQLLGSRRGDLMALNFNALPAWRDSGLLEQARRALDDGQPRRIEGSVVTMSGKEIKVESRIMVTELNGTPHLLVQFFDLSERHQIERELTAVLKFNASILLNSPLPMRVFAADGRCIEANDAFARLVGVSRDDLLAQGAYEESRWHVAALVEDCRLALSANGVQRRELQVVSSSGRNIWLESRIVPVDVNGGSHLLAQFVDLTERRRLEQELRMLAFYDALTQLPNRRLLLDRLKQAIVVSQRRNSYAALLFMDLNKFKLLNDTHGHDAGDQLLVKVARRLRALVRQADTVARLGGDEFVVLLEELGGDCEAAQSHVDTVSEKISRFLSQEYQLGDIHYSCTVSIGSRLFCGDENDADEILKHADVAMYLAKRSAR